MERVTSSTVDEPSSSASSPTPNRRKLSPACRQDLLTKRVLRTLQQQQQQPLTVNEHQDIESGVLGCDDGSTKRLCHPPEAVHSASSIPFPTNHDSYLTLDQNITPIDLQTELWGEITSIFPLLSYGEESSALFGGLLDFLLQQPPTTTKQQQMVESLGVVVEGMLKAKKATTRQAAVYDLTLQSVGGVNVRVEEGVHVGKKQRLDNNNLESISQSPKKQSVDDTTNITKSEMLPWNVLLRMTIRIMSHVARQLQSLESTKLKEESELQDDGTADNDEELSATIHPILQALDIVLADLHLIMKTARQQSSQESDHRGRSSQSVPTTPTKPASSQHGNDKGRLVHTPPKASRLLQVQLPNDKMLRDWRSGNKIGPSRYAFLKDVELITNTLDYFKALGISADEWDEKITSVLGYIDEYVSLGCGSRSNNNTPLSSPFASPTKGGGSSKGLRSLLANKSPLSSPFKSPMKGGSTSSTLADVTRSHVKRTLELEKEAERYGSSTCLPDTATLPFDRDSATNTKQPDACISRLNDAPTSDSTEEETTILEDAYRMAIAFATTSSEGVEEGSREMIERRLELLVRAISQRRQANSSAELNIDGAEAYLESLLRDLVQPPDPKVWLRLMNDSHGKESPLLLRRGRSLLVSFLIEIKSPGWESVTTLEASPLPSYLGCLPCRDKQQDSALRSSFLLPIIGDNDASMPPPPIVSELGLSLCVGNFVRKGATDGKRRGHQHSGVSLFKKYGPLNHPTSTSDDNEALASVTNSLPDAIELTRDLFDLTLRLAADDDNEHRNKPFALRLATPSASESLDIAMHIVSDHSEWLSARCIASRYQFVIEEVMRSFQSFGEDEHIVDDISWANRVSSLVTAASTVQNRARIVLYATHFMMFLCGKGGTSTQSVSTQPHFYSCLQIQQFSQFWCDIDKTSSEYTSSTVARVFGRAFCSRLLLPFSHRCSLHLAEKNKERKVASQFILSVVNILSSVFNLLAEDGLLSECVHVGWAVQMLLLSIAPFIFGESASPSDPILNKMSEEDAMWGQVARQLHQLYTAVWAKQYRSVGRHELSVSDVVVDEGNRGILMPSFNVLAPSLIRFASTTTSNASKAWCRFVANFIFGCYSQTQQLGIISSWICQLASFLQEEVIRRKTIAQNNGTRERKKELSTEHILEVIMTPSLIELHSNVMERTLRTTLLSNNASSLLNSSDRDMVAFAYVDVLKEESSKFLNKPTPLKTRRWGVYRRCIEKMFLLTPPSTLFAHPDQHGLSDTSAAALKDIWNQYGQCDLTQSILIMVAAGMHVNDSAASVFPNRLLYTHHEVASVQLKQLYNVFSSCAKECIIATFNFKKSEESKCSSDDSLRDFSELVRSVRKELTLRASRVGLAWWNELVDELRVLLTNNISQDTKSVSNKSTSRGRDIAKAFSALDDTLSAISRSITHPHA
ncbi:predicted protein [Thalassiosira pseudonana CCMP1335]|uniref:Uncharacterized protein n=1 Tax=Thalassiosira pseudonana TaxID=35128 RepID=B8C125_THAPS|nr:predicted protein [Thalassiosira pseudonana CCMP1335]EED93165.1 predicted protein [Thalassiosira pseudonana CCMP1335]